MEPLATVQVPGGTWRDGTRHRLGRIRPPTGHDEEWLAEHADEPAADLATGLLGRCVVELGGRPPTPADLEALTVGDREALLWHLRRTSFGDRVDAVVECGRCAEKLDVALRLTDLLAGAYDDWAGSYTETVAGSRVTFRLPTGADQAGSVAAGADAGAQRLLERCVLEVDGAPPDPAALAELADRIGEAMAARDPQAETRLQATCPACSAPVDMLLDALAFLREEMLASARTLLAEVHTMAWHYHWSEADILGLAASRRRAYLELIAGSHEDAAP